MPCIMSLLDLSLEGGRYSALALKRFSPAREMDMSWREGRGKVVHGEMDMIWREGREKVVRRYPGKVQVGERTESWCPPAKVKIVIC